MRRFLSIVFALLVLFSLASNAEAQITASPSSFNVTLNAGSKVTHVVTISNPGAAVSFSSTFATTTGGLWIVRDPRSGTLPGNGTFNLSLTLDATSTPPGTHQGSLTISPSGRTPIVIPITIVVKGLQFTVLPASATHKMTDAEVRTQSITVSSNDSFTAGVTVNYPWVTLDKSSAPVAPNAPATFTATIRPQGVKPGLYYVNLVVNSINGSMAAPTQTSVITVAVFSTDTFEATPATPTFTAAPKAAAASPSAITVQLRNLGADCTYSLNAGQSWLKLSKFGGSIAANGTDTFTVSASASTMTSGTYTGSISVSASNRAAFVIPVVINVGTASNMSLQPVAVSFNGTAGESTSLPAANTVTISNTGSSVAYALTPGAAWLKLSKSGGTLPQDGTDSFSVSANPATLPVGTAKTTVTVTAAGRPTRVLDVTFYVGGASDLSVSPGSLSLSASAGVAAKSAANLVTVTNRGPAVAYTIAKSAAWLTLSKTAGSLAQDGSDTFSVSADPAGLASGNYSGTVTVNATGRPSRTIAVSFSVTAADDLTVSPANLSFTAVAASGVAAPAQTVQLVNQGGAVTYTVAKSAAWMVVSRTSGSLTENGAGSFTVAATPGTLAAGNYTGTVTVTAPGRPTRTVAVAFSVTGNADLTVSLSRLTFSGVQAQATSGPASSTVTVTNKGAAVAYTIVKSVPWLTVSKAGGSLAANGTDKFTVSASPSTLKAGTHAGTITVSAPGRPSRMITVTFNVYASEDLVFAPSAQAFTGLSGYEASTPAKPGIRITNRGGQVSYTLAPSHPWLVLSKTSGSIASNSSDVFYLSANSKDLAPGNYTATITVTAANRPVRTLPVSLSVTAATGTEKLSITPDTLSTTVKLKTTTPKFTITVQNTGPQVSYTVASQAKWLLVSKSIGLLKLNGTDSFTVSFSYNLMPPGAYTGAIVVRSPARPDCVLNVELNVQEAAATMLSAFPPSLEFVLDEEQPKKQSIQFFSADGKAVRVRLEPEAGSPLAVEQGEESMAPGTSTVKALQQSQGLEAGSMETRLVAIPEEGDAERLEVPVTLRRPEPNEMSVLRMMDGGGYSTRLVLENLDSEPAQVTLEYFRSAPDSGSSVWPLLMDGQTMGEAVWVAPGESVVLQTRGLLDTTESGWARIRSHQKLAGYAVLLREGDDGTVHETRMPLNRDWQQRIALPLEQETAAATSVILANLSADEDAVISVLIRDQAGEAISQPLEFRIPAMGHQAYPVGAWLDGESTEARILEISARGGRMSSLAWREGQEGRAATRTQRSASPSSGK